MNRVRWLFSAGLAALAFILIAPVFAAAGDEAVALPPFLVEETTKGPPWRYTHAAGFEILSRCPDSLTRKVIAEEHRIHSLLTEILPPQLRLKLSVQPTLILYDEALQPVASQEVLARMLEKERKADVAEAFRDPNRQRLSRNGSEPRYTFLPNLRLWDRDAMAVLMIVRSESFDGSRLALTQDYITFLLANRLPALPPWFVSGFLHLYRNVSYESNSLRLEPLEWAPPPAAKAAKENAPKRDAKKGDAPKEDPAQAAGILPLAELLVPSLPASLSPGTASPWIKQWQAQAALFVRWGLDPEGGRSRREALWNFADRSAVEGATEKLFQECFGLSFAAARDQLAAYLPQATKRAVQFRPGRLPPVDPFELQNATEAQIVRIKGDMERLEVPFVRKISPELVSRYLDQARRTFQRAYDRGERDPGVLAAMALCEIDAGNDAAARSWLETAAHFGTMRPRACFELARLRFEQLKTEAAAENRGLSPEQSAQVMQPLFATRTLHPPLPEVYDLIADVWLHSRVKPTRRHLAVLDEGVALFPRRTALVLRAAEVYVRHGYKTEAMPFILLGQKLAADEATRARFTQLQQLASEP